MDSAFTPVRLFLGRQVFQRLTTPSLPKRHYCIQAKIKQRDYRRAVQAARTQRHQEIKRELERQTSLQSVIVSIPRFVRERCSLNHRMARVKVFMGSEDMSDLSAFRDKVRSGLVRLFPELEQRGLLRVSDGFDIKVGGSQVVHDYLSLQHGLRKCDEVAACAFVEVIPHNVPPPKPPYSSRVNQVREKVAAAVKDPNMRLHMISFYKFVVVDNPELVANTLYKAWARMGVKGRVYVAKEGVNAQLSVPDVVLEDFRDVMNGSWTERGAPLVPKEFVGVFLNTDRIVHHSEQPFQKLSVRPRDKVLADGFAEALDWNRAGKEVSPDQWHSLITDKSEDTIVLDCRNKYESDVGRFEGAEPLDTNTFRESWKQLEQRLQHEPRDKKILTYCTGGIRCVKVNGWLEQKMGFTNTARLEGGIVSYVRQMREQGRLEESAFKGVNHVFDGRMGEVVTEDLLDRCINCNQACNHQTDCANTACPRPFQDRMFVQCEDCASMMKGACSITCRDALRVSGTLPETTQQSPSSPQAFHFVRDVSENDRYADAFTSEEDQLLREVRLKTEQLYPSRAHMLSSHTQASLLGLLIKIGSAGRVLEIGTFTGYATVAMAKALPMTGSVVTCERDDDVLQVARSFFKVDESLRKKISTRHSSGIDAIAALVSEEAQPFDLAFIDADKGSYKDYLDALLCENLIRVGGLLVFDNVLFRNEVASLWTGSHTEPSLPTEENELVVKRLRNLENTKKIAKKLHSFNQHVRDHKMLEQVLLPVRDGLTIARRIR